MLVILFQAPPFDPSGCLNTSWYMEHFDRNDGAVPWDCFNGIEEQDPGALEIIIHCLNINPDRRPTITQLLSHPYIANAPAEPTTEIINELQEILMMNLPDA